MAEDEPVRRKRISLSRENEDFFIRYAKEVGSASSLIQHIQRFSRALELHGSALSPAVAAGIARVHDDMMARLAMIPAQTSQELAEKVQLLEGRPSAMPGNSLLPDMISAALVENAVRLAIPDAPPLSKRRKK